MLDWQKELQRGELVEARNHLIEGIKKQPKNAELRSQYVELLCIDHLYEKADEQLMSALKLFPEFLAGVRQLRSLIKAAQKRQDFIYGAATATFSGQDSEYHRLILSLNQALVNDNSSQAKNLNQQAEKQRITTQFEIDGKVFADVRDADDRLNGYIELYSSEGNYHLVPLAEVAEMDFLPASSLLESVIRPVAFVIDSLGAGEGHMPTTYPISSTGKEKLGSETDWQAMYQESVFLGKGAKVWLADEEGLVLSQISKIKRC